MKKLNDGTEVPIDTPTRMTSKGRILLTNREISNRERDKQEWDSGAEQRDWDRDIADTDIGMPRYIEDVIDVLTDEQRSALPESTFNKYVEKKTIRSRKP